MKRRSRHVFLTSAVSVFVSAGLVCWLISRIDISRVAALFDQMTWAWLVFAALAAWLIVLASVFSWYSVLRALQVPNLTYREALKTQMTANLINSFVPSKAGDMVKVLWLRKRGGMATGLGAVAIVRMVDLLVLGGLALMGGACGGPRWGLATGGLLVAGVAVTFAGLVGLAHWRLPMPARIERFVHEGLTAFRTWSRHPAAMARTVAGSFVQWLAGGAVVVCLASALGQHLAWVSIYAYYPSAVVAGLLPLTISGIGTRDAAFAALLRQAIPVEEATLVGFGYTVFVYWFLALSALPFATWNLVAYTSSPRSDAGDRMEG